MNYTMEELLPVVAGLSEKYTGKESTSVTYETVEQLMGAVIYCIHEYETEGIGSMQEMETTEIRAGDEKPSAQVAYGRGYEKVINKVLQAKKVYEELIVDFHTYGNWAYEDTVIRGMPAFFINYDPKFCPQDHMLTLDYPTIKPLGELCGVDAIYQYLQYISLEQMFLAAYSYSFIEQCLLRYHPGHKELFINVSSVVMRDIIGKMADVEEYVKDHTGEETEEKLLNTLQLLMKEGYDSDEKMLDYLKADLHSLVVELYSIWRNLE